MSNQALSDKLENIRYTLMTARADDEISSRLAAYGFDGIRIEEGQSLYERCVRARDAAHEARLGKREMTESVDRMLDRAEQHYRELAHVARTLWSDHPAMLERLGLRTRRRSVAVEPEATTGDGGAAPTATRMVRKVSKSQAAFMDRAMILYGGAADNATVRDALAQYGFTPDRLKGERTMLENLERALVSHERVKLDSKERTAQLYQALDELNRWMIRMSAIAEVALADRPDLLRRMGIKSRLRRV